jgi:hypothetical protein
MSTKSSKNGAYDMLVAQKDTITKITASSLPNLLTSSKTNWVGHSQY